MSTVTEEIAGQIDERVDQIQDEIRKLEEARAALTGIIAERKTARPRTRDHEATRKPDPRMARPGTAPHTLPRSASKRAVARRQVLERMKSERENRREKLKVFVDETGGPIPVPKTRKKRRPSRGSRPLQVLALIEAEPGIPATRIVSALKDVNQAQIYKIVKTLSAAGEIVGDNKGWRLKD